MAVPPEAQVPPAVPIAVVNPSVVTTAVVGVVEPIAGLAAKTDAKLDG